MFRPRPFFSTGVCWHRLGLGLEGYQVLLFYGGHFVKLTIVVLGCFGVHPCSRLSSSKGENVRRFACGHVVKVPQSPATNEHPSPQTPHETCINHGTPSTGDEARGLHAGFRAALPPRERKQ